MQHRDLLVLGFALLAFGCSKPPEAVFVDLAAVAKRDELPAVKTPSLPPPVSVSIAPYQVSLPRSQGVLILDKAEGKIEIARKLIQADRNNAIRTLSRRLASVRSDEIDVQKIKALEELQQRQAAYLATVYGRLYEIFERYAKERGPKLIRAELLQVRKPDLFVSRGGISDFAKKQREEMEGLRGAIRQLDSDYNKQANKLLDDAQIQLSAEQGALQAKFETLRANAIEQAGRDARRTIEQASKTSDLNLGQNRSVVVSSVRGESVRIAGSSQPKAARGLDLSPVADTAQRRAGLEEQLGIWLRTRGYEQAQNRSQGRDATEEFIAWRKSHRLGH